MAWITQAIKINTGGNGLGTRLVTQVADKLWLCEVYFGMRIRQHWPVLF